MAQQQQEQQRWAFVADWLDPGSGVLWTYQLFAHLCPDDQSGAAPVEVEMFDIKNRRHFLRRVKCEGLRAAQLYVGSTVTVCARQLHLASYADVATRRAVEARAERTLALIKPGAVQHAGKIIHAIYSGGLSVINLRMCQLSAAEAAAFCAAGQAGVAALSSGPVIALEVMAPSGIRKLQDLLVRDGVAGLVLEEVQAGGFDVTGLQLFNLDKQAAAEFLEVYKGVVPSGDWGAMVDELVSGPCIAVEVASRDGAPAVEAFRQLVGPRDPELGRVLRPHTLRARFGVSCVRNAVHCTDLEEDGELEAAYFFSTLQQPQQQPNTSQRLIGTCC